MTIYVVKAKPKEELMADLRRELSSGKISKLRPFGEELHHGLENARAFEMLEKKYGMIYKMTRMFRSSKNYVVIAIRIT